ncbi:hypothetical protein KC207_08610 [Phycicoccus sp. BSK3Z-2]|uniref:Uncharacterized protein n=1 Tax=Phycicoccus avicenniae TaxID=2828860 RepID=A0A941D762_9MICO|nr:hypothetical protein [Phycicoccus avicenniae]MBR7743349.1 hypothetical protein [Phycicoccus avicenniae]
MSEPVVEVVGVYNADGGVLGEIAYVLGHAMGSTDCSLCDVTHGGIRRRPAWDEMVGRLPVPVRLAHRNETTEGEKDLIEATGLPVLIGKRRDGSLTTLVPPLTIAAAEGSVDALEASIREALDDEGAV